MMLPTNGRSIANGDALPIPMTWSTPAGAPERWAEEPAAEFAAIDTVQHGGNMEI